jgi:hypothetical protein
MRARPERKKKRMHPPDPLIGIGPKRGVLGTG